MTIEEWRDKAMVYRDAVERLIAEKESVWVEMTCQREAIFDYKLVRPNKISEERWNTMSPWVQRSRGEYVHVGELLHPACGQKFKVLRVAVTPYCPKCGYAQDLSRPGIRESFANPEVV